MDRRKVLCVSFDKTVSDDPYAILTEADYDVAATSDIQDALGLLSRERFDAVIIGHRFHREEKYALAVEAKEKWSIPVVLVCGTTAELEIPATCRVSALRGHAGLLSAVSEVISGDMAKRAAA
jgi:DNA-binding NtrC family response regulator